MAPLPVDLRNQLARAIQEARREGEAGARKALQSLAVHLGKAHDSMDAVGRSLRGRLRAHGKQLGDVRDPAKDTQQIDRLVHEVAYEHWHRMLFARFLAENNLLIEPTHGVAISMEECEELARAQGGNPWALAASYAQAMLPKIFRVEDPVLDVQLPPETRLALERILQTLPSTSFTADDSLGWTYQFWQAEKKDEVNRSGVKIGPDELPAVTQLFTEHYMVLFLFHNTIGAWRAGKILAANPDLARNARDEEELRRAVRLSPQGGYDFSYLRFVRERAEGDTSVRGVRLKPDRDADAPSIGPWRPAAGTFEGWPARAADLRVLDPCCGSGHFLVEGFELIVRLRMDEERLSVEDAIRAVLAENLFGLEIDPRCTQIAAFNLALAAWKLAGKPIDLPPLSISCAGISVGGTRDEWLALLDNGAESSLRFAFGQLYDLFRKAPSLGSLIDPGRFQGGAMLDRKGTEALLATLSSAVARDRTGTPERHEMGVAAQGIARATDLLRDCYTLVITNVPYLGRGKQDDVLRQHVEDQFALGKADLATAFVQRALDFCSPGGTTALVTPQNWLFLMTYTKLRQTLLHSSEWNVVARLGPGAFETISGEVVSVALLALSARKPDESATMAGIDVSTPRGQAPIRASEKAAMLRGEVEAGLLLIPQAQQLRNPDAVISTHSLGGALLSAHAFSTQGLKTGDDERWRRMFWEVAQVGRRWRPLQSTVDATVHYGGRDSVIDWSTDGAGLARLQGMQAWRRPGVVIKLMGDIPATLYCGDFFDSNVTPLVPDSEENLPPIWCFCESGEFAVALRRLNSKLSVAEGTVVKVPFDIAHWKAVAAERYPHGLPKPETDDPRQWLFHGRPEQSTSPLHVAVTRLLGYRWPAELDGGMPLSERARALVRRSDEVHAFADDDGIVCIPSVRGDKPAADRLLALLSTCGLKADRDLDAWLRSEFFEEHCKLFNQRPVIWHVWDGRPDGFHALVNYHKLAGPNPDINDGVRINIRPFMSVELRKGGRAGAGILRWKPNITWKKDRGTEPKSIRPIEQFPWFWGCPGEGSLDERTDFKGGAEFDGCRWNDLHYSTAKKLAARDGALRAVRQGVTDV